MTDSEVLAMELNEMEFFDLIKWKQNANKRPAIDEDRQANGQRQASSGLVLAERDKKKDATPLQALFEPADLTLVDHKSRAGRLDILT